MAGSNETATCDHLRQTRLMLAGSHEYHVKQILISAMNDEWPLGPDIRLKNEYKLHKLCYSGQRNLGSRNYRPKEELHQLADKQLKEEYRAFVKQTIAQYLSWSSKQPETYTQQDRNLKKRTALCSAGHRFIIFRMLHTTSLDDLGDFACIPWHLRISIVHQIQYSLATSCMF